MAEHGHDEHESSKGHGGGGHGGGGHGPGGGGHAEGEHEGAPEWLISFADNVALMMGFFVVLLAMNMKPADAGTAGPTSGEGQPQSAEMLDWVEGVREAFNRPIDLESDDPSEADLRAHILAKRAAAHDPSVDGKHPEVENVRPTDYFSLGGYVPFARNSTELGEGAERKARELAGHLRGLRTIIDVRGHVSAPEAAELADRGMNLAYRRATAVAEILVLEGIGWERLRVIACGDNERKAQEFSDGAHRENQRVELVSTSDNARR